MKKLPTMTKRAALAISQIVTKVGPQASDITYIPIISWISESNQPGFIPGPCLALEVESKVPENLILQMHGIKIGFNMPEAKLTAHENFVLDFMEDRFLFISKPMADLLDEVR